jgi:predicted phosphodiesterase
MQSSGSEDTTKDRSRSGDDLLQHCNTLKQEEAVTLVYIEGMTIAAAARELGIDRKSLKERLEQVERRAERSGRSDTVGIPSLRLGSGRRVGVIGDTHLPYELDGYLGFCEETFNRYGVDTVIHIGDMFDNHSLSFHDSEPMLHNVIGEYESAYDRAQDWYDTFPEVTLIMGNHDRIPARQLRKLGMEPSIFMRPIEELFGMPDGWTVADQVVIDDVLYHHGETSGGINGFRKDAETRMRCTVSGHNHSNAGVSATATDQELVWGLAVGCGVNHEHMAFAYGKNFAKKPIISCGVVIDGEPHIEYMDLGSKVRRT